MERLPNQENQNDVVEKKSWRRGSRSPERVVRILEANLKLFTDKVTVHGLEHIQEIPPDKKVVLATSHASDLDMQAAAAVLSKHFDLAIANQSTQHIFREDPAAGVGMRIVGKKNFLPVDYKKVSGVKKPRKFNPDNFLPMAGEMENGKSVLIAAHNPSFKGTLERAGYGATYLAEITDAVIVPVGVNVKSEKLTKSGMVGHELETMVERPVVEVVIGEPFTAAPIEGLEDFAAIVEKRRRHEEVTPADIERLSVLKEQLRERSQLLLNKVAELMVPERQQEAASR